jgi:predicted amino acid dehydrogenase
MVLIDTKDLPAVVNNSDIIIKLDDSCEDNLNISELRPKAIICNYNCKEEDGYLRKDIAIINAGQIKLPFAEKLVVNTALSGNTVSAPLAETMLLTFEERFVNYSLDENTNLDKLEEIADIASRHGFEVWVPEAPVL